MTIDTYEKKDLVELLTADGLELTERDSDPPYLVAQCPLHNDRNPSFIVYPHIQSWTCFSCKPGWHDSISYFRDRYQWGFVKARDHCCTTLSEEEALMRHMKQQDLDGKVDMLHMTVRMYALIELYGVQEAQIYLKKIDSLLERGLWIEAERLLKAHNV